MHKPIQFRDFTLSFPHKPCISNFNGQILFGSRIAIIGRNGTGKSALLKCLLGQIDIQDSMISIPDDLRLGYLPQIIETSESLSGGERLNSALTQTLLNDPNLLLLDEPTNHLDTANRRSLMNRLHRYTGTLVIVSHDVEVLRESVDTLWHIDNEQIHVFQGRYDDYIQAYQQQRTAIEHEISSLNRQKKDIHAARMKEQQRVAKSRASGEKKVANKTWLKMVGDLKGMKAEKSQGKKLRVIDESMDQLLARRAELFVPEIITPTFGLYPRITSQSVVTIRDGCIGYDAQLSVLKDIHLTIGANERVALLGNNASGKSTLLKAMLQTPEVTTTGSWILPKPSDIGYLDQHYQTLNGFRTVFDALSAVMPNTHYNDIRRHLNDFLFRKNEEVEADINTLSGGEKARLCLCCIAAKPPTLLILDEMTNNLDLETKEHVIQILKHYEGAMIVVSHESQVISHLNLNTHYLIDEGAVKTIHSGVSQ